MWKSNTDDEPAELKPLESSNIDVNSDNCAVQIPIDEGSNESSDSSSES